MNAQQEAVAFWQFLEARGVRPSIRKVVAMMRLAGIGIDEANAYKWLGSFAARAPHPKAHRMKIPAQGQHDPSTPAAQIQHRDDTSPALYAGDKVSLVSKKEPSAPAPALFDSAPATVKPKKASPVPRLDLRTPAQVIADDVLVMIQPRITAALRGKTWSTWRGQNRPTLTDMAAAGCDADEIIEAWEGLCERRGYTILTMRWVADDMDQPSREAINPSDLLPMSFEVPPHPDYVPREPQPWQIPPWKRFPNGVSA